MNNIVWHQHAVTRELRAGHKGHRGAILWFTGLSGAGKSTLAGALESALHERGVHSYLLDGDNVRHGLCKDLGFSADDRRENIRRVGEVAKLMLDAGLIVLSAFVSPQRAERELVRELVAEGEFIEVHVATPLEVCESRDPKGLYQKARAGEIKDFTGISAPYEAPVGAELVIDTSEGDLEAQVGRLLDYLVSGGYISA
ncbi:adenylyl-sulfate kinase [Shewanella sedimentimangrovi]|uniref:Adenylyl-sulfate kinase n=1 Tax=Shewanella sedimentimangrovi TaxID=2814293 RepID=A0ABX7R206_9GAMM|nr:adenylyl-sulfate kinase [Shewanella sedimentimangrovi]QSX37859.1 adenylyl-sulfate kinase [Shewanella sedimentimangrovi]